MPAQKRSSPENLDALYHHFRRNQSRRVLRDDSSDDEDDDGDDEYRNDGDYDDDEEEEIPNGEEVVVEEEEEEEEVEDVYEYDFDDDDDESDGIPSDIEDEWHTVDLTLVRKDVQCAICLGIIKKTRTVMECLHRFCRECIDKSMRLGNNECPACRTHCASRRSLRDDPRYDAIIATLYSDIDKYEEEELSLQEEDKTRNNQIQASFAQIFQRQSEALYKRSSKGKDSGGTSMGKFPRKYRNAYTRRRRNSRSNGNQDSDDNEDETDHDENKDSASSDEHETSIKQRKSKRGRRAHRSLLSSSAANSDDGGNEDNVEARKEIISNSSWILWKAEQLSWGAAAARSHTRHGSTSGNKGSNNTRICKLVDHLKNLHRNDPELQVHLLLISLDKQSSSYSQQLHICCDSSLSVEHLREYIGDMTSLQAKDVEMLLVKQMPSDVSELSSSSPSISLEDRASLSQVVGPSMVAFVALKDKVTLAELQASGASLRGNLILAFRQKPEQC